MGNQPDEETLYRRHYLLHGIALPLDYRCADAVVQRACADGRVLSLDAVASLGKAMVGKERCEIRGVNPLMADVMCHRIYRSRIAHFCDWNFLRGSACLRPIKTPARRVLSSYTSTRPVEASRGSVPKWSNGPDCKSGGSAFAGSPARRSHCEAVRRWESFPNWFDKDARRDEIRKEVMELKYRFSHTKLLTYEQ